MNAFIPRQQLINKSKNIKSLSKLLDFLLIVLTFLIFNEWKPSQIIKIIYILTAMIEESSNQKAERILLELNKNGLSYLTNSNC